jgi:RNA polymerase sigma factor (sigma-70 family)
MVCLQFHHFRTKPLTVNLITAAILTRNFNLIMRFFGCVCIAVGKLCRTSLSAIHPPSAIRSGYDRSMPWDSDTAIGGPQARFPSTQLTLIEAATGGLRNEALERVIALYWKPVYRFIRRKFGKDNEDAKDLTQAFFASALEREFFERFDPGRASFRTYLRMAVEHFASNEHAAGKRQKRGGDVVFEPIEEQRSEAESPEQVFEREWQRQLFALAVDDLRTHCEQNRKRLHFQIFEAYDLSDDGRPSYAELAARHGIPETAVTNYLAWARRTLKMFVTERMRGVTASERELREEMRRIWT